MNCIFVKNITMTPAEQLTAKHKDIREKLKQITFPEGTISRICWEIGASLNVSGPTVQNYIAGGVKDGYLAEAIYAECKRRKLVKLKIIPLTIN